MEEYGELERAEQTVSSHAEEQATLQVVKSSFTGGAFARSEEHTSELQSQR